MTIEVKVPSVGESITEGTILNWHKSDGERVSAREPLFELETDKITMTVEAEEAGALKILAQAGTTVNIGQVVATLDPAAAGQPAAKPTPAPVTAPAAAPVTAKAPAGVMPAVTVGGPETAKTDDLMPAVRRMVLEHGLDPAAITGTGKNGRLTTEDVVRHMETRAAPAPGGDARATEPVPAAAPAPAAELQLVRGPAEAASRTTRKKMTSLRKRIAERLVEAQHQAAMLTTFNEADMSAVMALRAKYKEPFKQAHDVGLGFMPFFVKASVEGLRAVPNINAQVDGDEIVYNHYYDIGVAVGTERGLVVPVVREADKLSFAGVEKAIAGYAEKARTGTLRIEDLQGGVFTISNGGVYGSMLSTPILNPPQSAILGMHRIQERPVAIAGKVEIRPMMYLAVSYDHRIVDGKEAVTFLKRIVECLENPERMLLNL